MELDQLKNLIERSSFLAYDEKGVLISRLPSLPEEKRKKLGTFLAIEESKFVTINLKYAAVFQATYVKWQNTFDQISALVN